MENGGKHEDGEDDCINSLSFSEVRTYAKSMKLRANHLESKLAEMELEILQKDAREELRNRKLYETISHTEQQLSKMVETTKNELEMERSIRKELEKSVTRMRELCSSAKKRLEIAVMQRTALMKKLDERDTQFLVLQNRLFDLQLLHDDLTDKCQALDKQLAREQYRQQQLETYVKQWGKTKALQLMDGFLRSIYNRVLKEITENEYEEQDKPAKILDSQKDVSFENKEYHWNATNGNKVYEHIQPSLHPVSQQTFNQTNKLTNHQIHLPNEQLGFEYADVQKKTIEPQEKHDIDNFQHSPLKNYSSNSERSELTSSSQDYYLSQTKEKSRTSRARAAKTLLKTKYHLSPLSPQRPESESEKTSLTSFSPALKRAANESISRRLLIRNSNNMSVIQKLRKRLKI